MKADVLKIGTALILVCTAAQGQGLLSLGQRTDYKENIPLTVNVTAGGGYDHTTYGGSSSSADNVDSAGNSDVGGDALRPADSTGLGGLQSTLGGFLTEIKSFGFDIPLIENPLIVAGLLLGKPVDLSVLFDDVSPR